MQALTYLVEYFQQIIADIIATFNDFLAIFGMGGIAEDPTAE